jgi:N6-L-threonylcarbamoyladenine synthase
MRILGIETSCDETAAAIVGRDRDGVPMIVSSIILSQVEQHAEYGGVVPEIAARAHLSALDRIIEQAVKSAKTSLRSIDGIAATAGPGLIGGLLVGLTTAKALAACLGKPLIAVNHLEAHALTPRLTDNIAYPYLTLLVSGGHTQIICVRGLAHYERWATTIDDALGEAFDKTAKLLGLGFPGGPNVEKAAIGGDPERFHFPRPLKGQNTLNFSLSGLKTAVRIEAERLAPLTDQDISDICASFQQAVCDMLADRTERAIRRFESEYDEGVPRIFVAAGGVAANRPIRNALQTVCATNDWRFIAPPLQLCGDNAAMIAWTGLERLEAGLVSDLRVAVRSRWPLDENSEPLVGSGKRGAKA